MCRRQLTTARDVAREAERNPEFLAALRADPLRALNEVRSPLPDNWVYRLVVISLGLAVFGSLGFAAYLLVNGLEVHPIFIATASGAIGALTGLLAPSPAGGA